MIKALLFLALIATASCATIYVKEGATSSETGATDQPFKTLKLALTDTTNGCGKTSEASCTVILQAPTTANHKYLVSDVDYTVPSTCKDLIVQGVSASAKQAITHTAAKKIIVANDQTVKFKWISDITVGADDDILLDVAGAASKSMEFEEVDIVSTGTPKRMTLVKSSKGEVVITKCNFGAKPATNGFIQIAGDGAADANLGKLTVSESTFKAMAGTAGDLTKNFAILNLVDGVKATIESSTFESNTDASIVVALGDAQGAVDKPTKVVFSKKSGASKGCVITKNTGKKPFVLLYKGAQLQLVDSEFTENVNSATAAVTTAGSELEVSPIFVHDSFVTMSTVTVTSNKGINGGFINIVVSKDIGTILADAKYTPSGGSAQAVVFNAITATKNVASGVASVVHYKNTHTAADAWYKTIVDASSGATGVYTIKGIAVPSSDPNLVGTDGKKPMAFVDDKYWVLPHFATTMKTAQPTDKTLHYLNNVDNSVDVPKITYQRSDVFGNALTTAPTNKPQVWLFNNRFGGAYQFADASGKVAANTKTRILTNQGTKATTFPASLKTKLELATDDLNKTFASLIEKPDTTCAKKNNWWLTSKATWASAANDKFELSTIRLNTTQEVWYMVTLGDFVKADATFLQNKNMVASTDSSVEKIYYIMPLLFSDNVCNVTAVNCKKNQYVDNKTCKDCNAECGQCKGPANTDCTVCPNNALASKLGTCKCATATELMKADGTCATAAALKTTVASQTYTSQGTIQANAQNAMSYYNDKLKAGMAVKPDLANPCKGADGKACNSKGNCTANVCKCDTGYSGQTCSFAKADLDAAVADVKKIAAGLKATFTTVDAAATKIIASTVASMAANPITIDGAAATDMQGVLAKVLTANAFSSDMERENVLNAISAVGLQTATPGNGWSQTAAEKKALQETANTQLDTMISNIYTSKLASFKKVVGQTYTFSNDGMTLSSESLDVTKQMKPAVGGSSMEFPADYKPTTLTTPLSSMVERNYNQWAFVDTTTKPLSPVLSAKLMQESSSKVADVKVDATLLSNKNMTIKMTASGASSTAQQQCAFYDTSAKKWSTTGFVQSKYDQTAVECTIPHLTDFTTIEYKKPSDPTTPSNTSAVNVVMSMALSMIIALFSLMY